MELTNSKRLLYKASYVTTKLTPDEQQQIGSRAGGGYPKAYMMQLLHLTPRDLEQLRTTMRTGDGRSHDSDQDKLLSIAEKLSTFGRAMSTMELAAAMAPIPQDALDNFVQLSSTVKASPATALLGALAKRRATISPIGRLHLERIEMYPAGVQKGELVFTVPMAPGETVSISHKEWATSSREFEEIVQDYFESYSEKGVAEKSDASTSSENEARHSNALNFGASLSGTYTGVTLTTTLGLSNTNEERQSVKQSMAKSREVTEKASARTRQEHKVSVKIETKSGTEDRSAKTITNDSDKAVRIDYYRMMRKWKTDLYRYGLRLTYDVAIPLPGVRLWSLHQQLADMDQRLRQPLAFPLKPEDIHSWTYRQEAIKWGTTVKDPPPDTIEEIKNGRIEWLDEGAADISRFDQIGLDVPAGYFVQATPTLRADLSLWPGKPSSFSVIGGVHGPITRDPVTNTDAVKGTVPAISGKSGHLTVVYAHRYVSMGSIEIRLVYELDKATRETWQFQAWTELHAAAAARHQEDMARLQDERDRLWRLLNGKDTLTLRRLEREELMRLVMQWLLGPDYPVVASPGDPKVPIQPGQDTLAQILKNEIDFQAATLKPATPTYSPTLSNVSDDNWYGSVLFGEFVKFVHEAIEWENILYFLYPYFWGSETIGRDKMLFEHSDPEHERFLRAGYARIVLTVRPGFEEDFTNLMEKGSLGKDSTHPYLTVADDIANFARTNYSGIPPANPELQARPLLYPEQRATWDRMQAVMQQVDAFKAANGHYPDDLASLPAGSPVDFWGNPFVYRMPGLGADYDLISLGADGVAGGDDLDADISSAAGASLVATWFDYTPTSGIDIEIDTRVEEIS